MPGAAAPGKYPVNSLLLFRWSFRWNAVSSVASFQPNIEGSNISYSTTSPAYEWINVILGLINVHSTTGKRQYYLPLWLIYRLPFELTDSAKLLHFTIIGGSADPPIPPKWRQCVSCAAGLRSTHEQADVHSTLHRRRQCTDDQRRRRRRIAAVHSQVRRPPDMELGHWVTGSVGRLGHLSRPGHRVIILTRCETRVFFGVWNNAQNAKHTFEMLKWQRSLSGVLLDWNHWMSVHAMNLNFYFYLWLLKTLWCENTSSHISRYLEFSIEQGHPVNWVSGSLDSRVTGSLGHKMWPSSSCTGHHIRPSLTSRRLTHCLGTSCANAWERTRQPSQGRFQGFALGGQLPTQAHAHTQPIAPFN